MVSLKHWQLSRDELTKMGVKLPSFDVDATRAAGARQPVWIHFGGGNLYRAFHAEIAQDVMDAGGLDRGVVVVETFSPFTVDEVYAPYDENILQVIMHEDGALEERVLASTAASLFCNPKRPDDYAQVQKYFESDELQFASFTITEKGYALKDPSGEFFGYVAAEIANGPEAAASTMGIVAALLLARYEAGAAPIALVSTDNFSQNGRRFRDAVLTIANGWYEAGHVSQGFIEYVSDESRVSFPWSMIDRITPNPAEAVAQHLAAEGWSDLPLIPNGPVNFAGFANTEQVHYLVVEDSFPNGRPALELGGVILTDRETVDKADTMKVTTCLNPLHTGLAVYGCLLGYTKIADEMRDADLVALVKRLGYDEGMPVVVNPGVIDPKEFIDVLVEHRLPNPSLPDAPQRIAQDTSQKLPIRYGHTINAYLAAGKSTSSLVGIPLVIAGWLRYLEAVDDTGAAFTPSPDPLLAGLQKRLADGGIELGVTDAATIHATMQPILSNLEIFDCDLYEAGLGERIEGMFAELNAGLGAVRATLHAYLAA
ncbi:mannitol dehydrogenase family protein [[Collinsella] massiliensis]|uniref:Mannitol dehydrogenase n=1 Tax=[Collinsella] massiliensis TaxID=1232426 RepID=A0A1Y3XWP0_9ACTN|nr:mannitol dehydrogenase family protein [[Collinsella] massiliensis]OUN89935.1 mannitol dehydrogenase [[Collinsella] massiliensis]